MKKIDRHRTNAIPRPIPIPIPVPAFAELLSPEDAEFGVGSSEEVDCFEDRDPVCEVDVDKIDTPSIDDSVEVGEIETIRDVDGQSRYSIN